MSCMPENHCVDDPLSVSDPDLSFLASQAALELDNHLLGKKVEFKSVKWLAARLECSTEEIGGTEARKPLMDTATVVVFSNAIAASGMHVSSLADLAKQAWEIANTLRDSSLVSRDSKEIKRMRAFCNHLARSVIAHERSLYDMQSVNTNWS